jgi:integrase
MMPAPRRKRRESFGKLKLLPSGRYQASYIGPDGKRHNGPRTFDNLTDGRAWLAGKRSQISRDEWSAPRVTSATFDAYAREHIDTRTNVRGERLKPRTRDEYLRLLDGPLSEFKESLLTTITPELVRRWYSDQERTGKRTQASRAYRLLKSVMATAVADGYVKSNPCQIRGATKASTGKDVTPPTDAELAIIVATIDPRLSLLVEVAAWGGLRWGEITELRRGDVILSPDNDLSPGYAILSVNRAVTYTKSEGYTVGLPKSFAGIRTVALPASLTAPLRARLDAIDARDDALIFPSLSNPTQHLSSGAFALYWRRARAAAGRGDMPFHALRHFGATRYAMAGATAKELMRRMGHNDVAVAMRYQHDAGRDPELVRRMTDI